MTVFIAGIFRKRSLVLQGFSHIISEVICFICMNRPFKTGKILKQKYDFAQKNVHCAQFFVQKTENNNIYEKLQTSLLEKRVSE